MNTASLQAYLAARDQDPAIRLFARTTRAMRADAGFLAREGDAVAGLALDEEAPAPLAPTAFEQALARIEAEAELDDQAEAAAGGDDPIRAEIARLPSPAREAALESLARNAWRIAGPGIRRLPLSAPGQTHMELMRITPGFGAARHGHAGDELVLILAGAYEDGHDRYGPGDVSLARDGFSHAPKALPGAVCYVLAVTYGKPVFSGLLGLVQRATGFPHAPKMKPAQPAT